MTGDAFDTDGIVQAKRIIDQLEADLGRNPVYDEHEARLLRVLRILADQIEELRTSDLDGVG